MENEKLLDKLVINEIKTQSDYLADNIKSMIVSGEFQGGFAFPNETEFCKMLNVSRGTLREAYKILDTQGFIRRTKHGTYVKDRADIAEQGDFAASLELADKEEMVEFVCALEPEAAFLAAKKAKPEDIQKLETLMIACEAASDDPNMLRKRNYEFHAYIRTLADNNLIISALTAYYDIFNQQIIGNVYAHGRDIEAFTARSLKLHRQLFEAIKNHDLQKAREVAYKHLLDDIEALLPGDVLK